MNNKLLKIADYLNKNGFKKEADELEEIMTPASKAISFMDKVKAEYVKSPPIEYMDKLVNLRAVMDMAKGEPAYKSKNYVGWTAEDFNEAKIILDKEIKDLKIKMLKGKIEKLQRELMELEG